LLRGYEVRKAMTITKASVFLPLQSLMVMKNKYLLLVLCCFMFIFGNAQPGADTLPYRKYPTIPAFRLLLLDSSTILNTYDIREGHPVLFMFFGADCDHCEQLTQSILDHMDSLKHVQICMPTLSPLAATKGFYYKMNLERYKNIMVGRDFEYFFPKFYKSYYVPFLVVYDRKKKFVKAFDGSIKIKEVIESLQ
jgi:thiol-disulfide isomerase/thioredoxin